jgi:cytochrome c2
MTPHDHALRGCLAFCAAAAFLVLCGGGAAAFFAVKASERHDAPAGYAGDPLRGRGLVRAYGCLSCHAPGMVGPPLEHIGGAGYLAGHIPNVPGAMQQWIRYPRELKPGTAMPDLGVGVRDADDIAAYLATLR